MSRHDPAIALRQILSHSREAVQLSLGKSRSDLDNDRMLNLALTRLLEIIGEAANRVPAQVQSQYPTSSLASNDRPAKSIDTWL